MVQHDALRDQFDGLPHSIDCVDPTVDRGEVLRYVGYPSGRTPSDRVQGTIDHWIDIAAQRAQPRGVYVVLPVAEIDRRSLRLASSLPEPTFRGAIGEFLGPSRFVAAFIATAGPDVERLASQLLSQQDDLAAVIVNAVGAERAEAAESVIIDQLREQLKPHGFAPTLPYSPGYCGMALTEQQKLFAMFGEHTAGVTLSENCLMRPLKSVSGLIGIGPAEEIGEHGSPCDRCELHTCAMRR